jgi:hypothetical protein
MSDSKTNHVCPTALKGGIDHDKSHRGASIRLSKTKAKTKSIKPPIPRTPWTQPARFRVHLHVRPVDNACHAS